MEMNGDDIKVSATESNGRRQLRSYPTRSYGQRESSNSSVPDVKFEVMPANGEEAEALRNLQGQVMLEVMQWIVQRRRELTQRNSSQLRRSRLTLEPETRQHDPLH
ncbi:hypothetical protein ACQEU8_33120 [Streptomyces sp. CA-250714]|uniref:hypothetical protein n=1 Tax=Streptomyces sp. CA-250714 TaxID=3240060 RepID=UPI003D8E6650